MTTIKRKYRTMNRKHSSVGQVEICSSFHLITFDYGRLKENLCSFPSRFVKLKLKLWLFSFTADKDVLVFMNRKWAFDSQVHNNLNHSNQRRMVISGEKCKRKSSFCYCLCYNSFMNRTMILKWFYYHLHSARNLVQSACSFNAWMNTFHDLLK